MSLIGCAHRRALALPQPVRFLFAGGFAAAVNWLVRFPLSAVMPFSMAVLAAMAVGMAVGFVLYQTLVFPNSHRPLLARLRDFILVNLGAAVVVLGVADAAALALGLVMRPVPAEAAAHALGIATGALLNFAGHRAVTFCDTRPC